MRLFAVPPSLLSLLAITPSIIFARAAIMRPEKQLPRSEENTLIGRQCANPCGFYAQICCGPSEACITDGNNQAQCGPAGAAAATATSVAGQGNWQYYTTTYVETDLNTITTTFSSFFPIATQNFVFTSTVASQCRYSLGESPCGSNCCSAGQYCMTNINQCAAAGGGSSAFHSSFVTVTQAPSAPVRPTSNTVLTVTSTGSATATLPFSPPVGTDGSTLIGAQPTTQGSGLSAGAIAGIVIGVIAGIIILFWICVCCCCKGAIYAILGLFGGRRRRRTETTYIEERRSRHGSRPAGRTWFGSRPAKVDRTEKKKKSGGLGGLVTVGTALGALALFLGLKKKRDQRKDDRPASSYGFYSDSRSRTSTSSLSSGGRTRDSRRSRK